MSAMRARADMHVGADRYSCGCAQIFMWLRADIHVGARRYSRGCTQIFMWVHANIHVGARRHSCGCAQIFIASGVAPSKLVIVPEGVNTTLFDPAKFAPMELPQVVPSGGALRWCPPVLSTSPMMVCLRWIFCEGCGLNSSGMGLPPRPEGGATCICTMPLVFQRARDAHLLCDNNVLFSLRIPMLCARARPHSVEIFLNCATQCDHALALIAPCVVNAWTHRQGRAHFWPESSFGIQSVCIFMQCKHMTGGSRIYLIDLTGNIV